MRLGWRARGWRHAGRCYGRGARGATGEGSICFRGHGVRNDSQRRAGDPQMMNKVVHCLSTAALICATAHALAQADKYPTKPVRMILPFTAGTQTDVLARLIGQKLTESLGKQIVVDNRSGAGGMIAMQTVANSVPDGYTLFFDSSAFAIRPHLYPKAAINISPDFQAVSLVASSPHVLVVSSQLDPKTLKEFLD